MSERKSDFIWAVIVVVVAVVILTTGWYWSPFMVGMMGMMGFGMGFMFLVPLAFLVLVGIGAYYLITEYMRRNSSSHSRNERSLEILKERYAKGEIAREQYLRMKEELK